VVINDFNIFRIIPRPDETDAVLVIDPDAVLSFAVSFERFEMVAGYAEIAEIVSGVEHEQLPAGRLFDGSEAWNANPAVQRFGVFRLERPDQPSVYNVSRHTASRIAAMP
jgi:hypothetical protein